MRKSGLQTGITSQGSHGYDEPAGFAGQMNNKSNDTTTNQPYYLSGFNNEFATEAMLGAMPIGQISH